MCETSDEMVEIYLKPGVGYRLLSTRLDNVPPASQLKTAIVPFVLWMRYIELAKEFNAYEHTFSEIIHDDMNHVEYEMSFED